MPDPYDLVVHGGTVVTPDGRRRADVGIRDGVFATVGEPGTVATTRTRERLDASGLQVLPGVIDAHVHFRDPGFPDKEDFRTGSAAAVVGGVTTVLDMPNTDPPTDSVVRARAKLRRARTAWCDVGLFGLVGDGAIGQLEAMATEGLVVGFKAFLGPTTGGLPAPSEAALRAAMVRISRLGMRIAVHAEDAALVANALGRVQATGRTDPLAHPDSRPVEAEVGAIGTVGALALETGCAVHIVHLSSAPGLAEVERWRARGADVTAEVSANHVFLGAEDMATIGMRMKMNPPVRLRSEGHGAALLEALVDGRLTLIASDHAPHTTSEKLRDDVWAVHAGAVGVETSLSVFLTHAVHSGRMTLERLVDATSRAPAAVWGLYPRKGAIAVGSDADLTIVDLDRPWVIDEGRLHGRNNLSPFRGQRMIGMAVATIVRGRIAMRGGSLVGEPGGRPVVRSS